MNSQIAASLDDKALSQVDNTYIWILTSILSLFLQNTEFWFCCWCFIQSCFRNLFFGSGDGPKNIFIFCGQYDSNHFFSSVWKIKERFKWQIYSLVIFSQWYFSVLLLRQCFFFSFFHLTVCSNSQFECENLLFQPAERTLTVDMATYSICTCVVRVHVHHLRHLYSRVYWTSSNLVQAALNLELDTQLTPSCGNVLIVSKS